MIPSEYMEVKSININFTYLLFKTDSVTFTNHTRGLQFLLTFLLLLLDGAGRRCKRGEGDVQTEVVHFLKSFWRGTREGNRWKLGRCDLA